jgi:poly(A) polymerase
VATDAPSIERSHSLLVTIGDIAFQHNTDVYVVGGYVRDWLLGKATHDIDITVVGDPITFARIVAQHVGSTTIEYERFRTALVPIGGTNVEFVGTRKEQYTKGSRKPVVVEGTLYDDLARRDFTINAMAVQLGGSSTGRVIDEFNGKSDLEHNILRTPLDPLTTMADDPLRMMRAARFASQLGSTLAGPLIDAMEQMSSEICTISQERITDEFLKILASPQPSIGLGILFRTGIMQHIFPEVHALEGVDMVQAGSREYKHKDVFWHTLTVVDNVARHSDNVWLRFATLMHDIAKPKTKRFVNGAGFTFHGHEDLGARWQKRIFDRLKLPLHHLAYVETLVRLHQRPMALVDEGVTDSAIRRLAVQAGDYIDDLLLLCRADVTTRNPQRAAKYLRNYDSVEQRLRDVVERDNLRAFQSPLRGDEIIALSGLPPSRTVGYIKWRIEEAILDGQIANTYEAAKAYFLQNYHTLIAEAPQAQFQRRGNNGE